jgi:hypothetical protein
LLIERIKVLKGNNLLRIWVATSFNNRNLRPRVRRGFDFREIALKEAMRIRKDDGKSDRKLCSKRREKSNWSGQSL